MRRVRINASKTKIMSALIPGEQRQVLLLVGEHLEEVDHGSILIANGQGTVGVRSRINLASSKFSPLQ